MKSVLVSSLALLLSLTISETVNANNVPQSAEQARVERAQQWINFLASDELQGRKTGTPEMDKVHAWLEQRFTAIGLKPLPAADTYRQEFSFERKGKSIQAVNYIGYLDCQCDNDKYIMIGAHYDHVGQNPALEGDITFNGADDDASGVVASLVIAELLAQKESLPFNIIIAAWDAEEMGLLGSKHFADSPLVPLSDIETGIMFELVGVPVDGYPNNAWMTGNQYSNLFDLLQDDFEKAGWSLDADPFAQMGLFMRSDNAPFALMDLTQQKAEQVFKHGQQADVTGIPMHAISVWRGQDHYHQVHDEAELIDVPNLVALSEVIAEAIANLPVDTKVVWKENPHFKFSRP
ncbi:M28 family peptidase [Kangiella koreensis]|uniref:Peptidase M28 n=1 Tax=Kangiella koreensis (strain DSM 16069 / JCM 12317 / KCTC 12182 / SW-125) TaxID=523791 RepID=C7R813_KANKD|nr:M28 family peptidase [Kangiella koreensis]ACV25795.1 peptidase M28 [Kangiella koreensis DSM 16069]